MKHIATTKQRSKFKVVAITRALEAAMMTLGQDATSDDEVSNEHPRSEQWLFVIGGTGTATVKSKGNRRSIKLRAGSLLVIEKGELHQIRNTGATPLRTINFYAPPAYSKAGELRTDARGRGRQA